MRGAALAFGIILLTLPRNAAAAGADVRGNAYCHRGATIDVAPDVLVVYDANRGTQTVTAPNTGDYRLHFPYDVSGANLLFRYWAGNRMEEHEWHLALPTNVVEGMPTYVLSGLVLQATCRDFNVTVEQDNERKFAIQHPVDRAIALAEVSTPIDPFGAWAVAPQAGWVRQWFSPDAGVLLDTAIGTRLLVGPTFGQYQTPGPFTPGGSPKHGRGLLPFRGGFGQFDVELHMARMAPVQYVVSLGMRVGVSHRDDMIADADALAWGPVLSARTRWSLGDRVAGVLQVHAQWQHTPYAMNPVGCVGPSTPLAAQWDAWGGVAIGVEMEP